MANFADLFKQLNDSDPSARQQAREALAVAGAAAPDALLVALSDIPTYSQYWCEEPVIGVLAEIGWSAVPDLIRTT